MLLVFTAFAKQFYAVEVNWHCELLIIR